MKTLMRSILAAAVATVAFSSIAAEPIKQEQADKVLAGMKKARPDIPFGQVFESPIEGVYRVTVGQESLYVAADGQHFIAGNLLEVTDNGFVDPLEAERAQARIELVQSIDKQSQIVYSPKGETRAYINVFTDVDCGYCRKMHRQMDEMNAQGIEVRYLAYPRAGLQSSAYKKIASAWCDENPQEALTILKNRQPLDENVCQDNPVASHMLLGSQVGVSGTPALLLADGRLVPGYLPVDKLLKTLGLEPI